LREPAHEPLSLLDPDAVAPRIGRRQLDQRELRRHQQSVVPRRQDRLGLARHRRP
jgi:hypothetical protein